MASFVLQLRDRKLCWTDHVWLFDARVGREAPATPALRPDSPSCAPHGEATRHDRRVVDNDIGTLHAIAPCIPAALIDRPTTDIRIPPTTCWSPRA